MRWLGNITDSLDMSLSKPWDSVKDREAWGAAAHEVNWTATMIGKKYEYMNMTLKVQSLAHISNQTIQLGWDSSPALMNVNSYCKWWSWYFLLTFLTLLCTQIPHPTYLTWDHLIRGPTEGAVSICMLNILTVFGFVFFFFWATQHVGS